MGVIATIAVAWACALFVPIFTAGLPTRAELHFDDTMKYWKVDGRSQSGASRLLLQEMRPFRFYGAETPVIGDLFKVKPDELEAIPDWVKTRVTNPPIGRFALDNVWFEHWIVEDARGWPFVSMASQTTIVQNLDTPTTFHAESDSVLCEKNKTSFIVKGEPWNVRVLPLRVIWPNFAYCTLFYATIAWFLFFGPGALRRWMRRRRNRCSRCGYDLRGAESTCCPECGEQICVTVTHNEL